MSPCTYRIPWWSSPGQRLSQLGLRGRSYGYKSRAWIRERARSLAGSRTQPQPRKSSLDGPHSLHLPSSLFLHQQLSSSPHFSIQNQISSFKQFALKMHSLHLLLTMAIGVCFFIPPLVQTICMDLDDDDIDELMFYHNAIRANVHPRAANMRQMV